MKGYLLACDMYAFQHAKDGLLQAENGCFGMEDDWNLPSQIT
jgi:hypothetical protein